MTLQDVLFYVLYISPFVVLALYRDNTGCHVFKVTCANVLMLFYMLSDHVGLILLYHGRDGIKQLSSTDPNSVILLAVYSSIVVLAYVGTGRLLGSRATRVRIPDLVALRRTRINWFPLLLVMAIAAPLAIWKALDNSPLLMLLSGDALGATAARVDEVTTGTHFLGIKPSYLATIFSMLAVVQVISLVAWMARKRAVDGLCFIVATLTTFLYGFSGVSKGAIVGPLYIIFFAYSLVIARGVMVNKALGWAVFYVFSVVAIFSAWIADVAIVSLWYPIERIVLGNLLPQYVVIDRFGLDNLLLGTTTPTWFSFGNHKQFLLDVFAWKEIMGWTEGAPFYTAPSSFVAEAHANWHVYGVVFMSLMVFYILRLIDTLLMRIKSEIAYVALMVVSSLHFSRMSVSGAISYLIDYNYWAIVLFALIFYRISLSLAAGRDKTLPRTIVAA